MIRIIPFLFVVSLTLPSTLLAKDVWHQKVTEAVNFSKSLNRPMIITIETPKCMYCETMRDTWKTTELETSIRNHFVALRLNNEEHANVVEKMKLKRYPTTIVYSSTGKLIAKKEGLMFAGECKEWLDKAKLKLGIKSDQSLVQSK